MINSGWMRTLRLTPSQVLVLGFATLILVGATVLTLPISSASGKPTPFVDALFTATSAVCVTGLIVVDTGTHWSPFGQIVVLALIQIGGLGIMTMSTLIALIVGKRITLRERVLMQEAFGGWSLSGLVRLTRQVLLITLAIEGIGATILAVRWSFDYPWPRAIYYGIFHAISAFCNAGFDLFTTSLVRWNSDPVVILTIGGLIIFGGLGFTVISDILKNRGKWSKLAPHSKLVLQVTAALIAAGSVLIFAIEYNNPKTMGPLGLEGKALSSFFHSVTPRTAGYNSVVTGELTEATLLLTVILMFIGASPASTGGGIKTTTFGVLVASVWATIRGRREVVLNHRRVPKDIIDRGLAITMISLTLVVVVTTILLLTEKTSLMGLLFETTSAFGTVGLSTGVTPNLTTFGKLIISATMFVGRVGPLTLAVALAQRQETGPSVIRYPEDRVMVG